MIILDERIGGQRLILGECISVISMIGMFDALLTDPPYGIGADKSKAQSSIRDNPKWGKKSWDMARPSRESFGYICKSSALHIIWGGNYFADILPQSKGWLSWRKPEAETGFSLADIELAWTSIDIASRQKTLPRRDGNMHPTQKPIALMEWCLGFLPNAQTILDPFAGSGTVSVACVNLGRQSTAIELDPDYYDIMCKRVDDAIRQPRLDLPEPKAKEATLEMIFDVAKGQPCP